MTIKINGPVTIDEDVHAFVPELSEANGGEADYGTPVDVSGDVVVNGNVDSSSEEELNIDGKLVANSLVVYNSTIKVTGELDVKLLCATSDHEPAHVSAGAPSEIPLVFRLWSSNIEGDIKGTLFDWDDNDNTEEEYERLEEAFEAIGLELSDEVGFDDVVTLVEEDKIDELIAYLAG